MFAADYVESVKERPYSSDLTPRQWELVKPLLVIAPTGRPIKLPLKDILDAIFYHAANGGKWRDLPHDFPDYRRVHEWFSKWRDDGTWDRLLDALRRHARTAAGHDPEPRVACLDSQTVAAAATGGPRRYDGGKRINGRKRHILVDSAGLLLAVAVTVGSVSDAAGAIRLLDRHVYATTHPRLEELNADAAYRRRMLTEYLAHECRVRLRLVVRMKPPEVRGFVPVKKRWVVERTFGWFGKYRGLARDYETIESSSEALVKVAMIHLILQRKLSLNRPATARQPLELAA